MVHYKNQIRPFRPNHLDWFRKLFWRKFWSPHYFWDSDVAKWIEGAAYIIEKTGNKELEKLCDAAIANIVKNQCEDGYFNSYFIVKKDEKRFVFHP